MTGITIGSTDAFHEIDYIYQIPVKAKGFEL